MKKRVKKREKHEFIDDFIDPNYKCELCNSTPPFCPECRELKSWIKLKVRKSKK